MGSSRLPLNVKTASVLRRVAACNGARWVGVSGGEGCVCAFRLTRDSAEVIVEAASGRPMTLVPGDIFLGTPGYRESTRVAVGGIPKGGLAPGKTYSLLSESGVVGELIGGTSHAKTFLGKAKYLGHVTDGTGEGMTIGQFSIRPARGASDHGAPVYLVVGTSAEVGKTTAGVAVLKTLLKQGHDAVTVLKATGTASIAEIMTYRDRGAMSVFDFVDFGLPSTYPSKRPGINRVFDRALDHCLCEPADAVLIECGGDMLAANIPAFLRQLRKRRRNAKVVLVAADALGALGGARMLRAMGLRLDLVTGPCTDTPALRQRTEALCRSPALNLAPKTS